MIASFSSDNFPMLIPLCTVLSHPLQRGTRDVDRFQEVKKQYRHIKPSMNANALQSTYTQTGYSVYISLLPTTHIYRIYNVSQTNQLYYNLNELGQSLGISSNALTCRGRCHIGREQFKTKCYAPFVWALYTPTNQQLFGHILNSRTLK